jgi:transcriptional regulator with XRE-family HTH domain
MGRQLKITINPHKPRALRHKRAMTLEEIATAVGVEKNTAWRWEYEHRSPMPANLQRFMRRAGMRARRARQGAAAPYKPLVRRPCEVLLSPVSWST